MDELEEIRAVLERYLSPLIARPMLQKALRERNITPERFQRGDAYKIGPLLQRGIGLFVSDGDRDAALRDLAALCERSQPSAKPCQIQINAENDISIVRNEARRICEELGAGSYIGVVTGASTHTHSRAVARYSSRFATPKRSPWGLARRAPTLHVALNRARRRACDEAHERHFFSGTGGELTRIISFVRLKLRRR